MRAPPTSRARAILHGATAGEVFCGSVFSVNRRRVCADRAQVGLRVSWQPGQGAVACMVLSLHLLRPLRHRISSRSELPTHLSGCASSRPKLVRTCVSSLESCLHVRHRLPDNAYLAIALQNRALNSVESLRTELLPDRFKNVGSRYEGG